ncbi:MAG: c-type cytochrome [Verrucomicrobiales bacterium]|nr:c-type cytochrome [Verrucomicrobiales bacterium]
MTEDDPGSTGEGTKDFAVRTALGTEWEECTALTGLQDPGCAQPQRDRVQRYHGVIRGWLLWVLVAVAGCGPQAGTAGTPSAGRTGDTAGPETAARDPRVELEAQGRYVFERNCVACHGRWGDGRGELAVGMAPRPSNLTRARFKFRSTPSGSLPTDEDLRRVVTLGIAGSSMPAFAALPDRDITAVITYLKTFSRRWDNPSLKSPPVAFPAPPSWLEDPEARPEHVRKGRELYRANCASCHGDTGRGDGPAAAALEDDAGKPAPPHDLTTGLWKSGRDPADLFRTLSTGMDGTPMPSFGDALGVGDRWDLVSFLLSLPAASQPGAR